MAKAEARTEAKAEQRKALLAAGAESPPTIRRIEKCPCCGADSADIERRQVPKKAGSSRGQWRHSICGLCRHAWNDLYKPPGVGG